MFNGNAFNSIEFNALGDAISSSSDISSSIQVATNPSFATFSEIVGRISVATQASPAPDELASITVSDYKWLTQSLKTAQLGPGYRPYYTCKVVDDTLQPLSIVTVPNSAPYNGDGINAPDGQVLAIGNANDGTGNLAFWKLADATTGWGTYTTLETFANWRNDLNSSIAVSDWINGTYVIDVYYYVNVSGALKIKCKRSIDGGTTFSALTINDISVSNSTTDNMYLSAGTPVLLGNGNVQGAVFYIKKVARDAFAAYYRICYQAYAGIGGTFSPETLWSFSVDSQDWTMHSLDSYWFEGSYYVVFAGYHNYYDTIVNSNFGIYSTRLDTLLSNTSTDTWAPVTEVFISASPSATNLNVFTYPKLSRSDNEFYLLFKAVVVEQVSTGSTGQQYNVITATYRYLMRSEDLRDFTYPVPLTFTDGTPFTTDRGVTFVPQGNYVYTIGNGTVWQYIKNNITADITNSIISYSIRELAGAASQITITLGNANNQWVGPSPTKTGASAIASNRKILLEQGYYNSDGVGETVPKNIFYIDDITQNVGANANTVDISGRDLVKKLKILTTKFAYTFRGITAYADIFNGSTVGNWNISSGTWSQAGGSFSVGNPGTGNIALATLRGTLNSSSDSMISCVMTAPSAFSGHPSGAYSAIYPVYVDSNNYIQFKVYLNGVTLYYNVTIVLNGTPYTIVDSFFTSSSYQGGTFNVMIRKYAYGFMSITIGSLGDINTPTTFDPSASPAPFVVDNGSATGVVNFGAYFTTSQWAVNGVPALGSAGYATSFKYFKYIRFSNSQSVQDIIKKVGTLSGITDYNTKYLYADTSFPTTDYNGTYTASQQSMLINPSQVVLNKALTLKNGELQFTGRVLPTSPSASSAMNILCQVAGIATSTNTYYRFEIEKNMPSGFVVASLYLNLGGTETLLTSSSPFTYTSAYTANGLTSDIMTDTDYKIVLVDQFLYLFIDDRLVLSWQDNNTVNTGISFSTGAWGFKTDSNSSVYIKNVKSRLLWNQIERVSINPGDQLDTMLKGITDGVRAWTYSDLMGHMTGTVLNSGDVSTYTYDDAIYSQQSDASDKEYVNQVTVYGAGVSAVYQNASLIVSAGQIREMAVVDYKITTYDDAYIRAQNELINANRFLTQNSPIHPLNVGSEIFDPVTIINVGDNSTDTDGDFRVYNQTIANDGSKGQYNLKIETGQI